MRENFALQQIARRGQGHKKHRNMYRADKGNGCVYAISSVSHSMIKFGRSVAPYARMAELQTGSPYELMMVSFIEVGASFACKIESAIHSALKCGGYLGQGEWWNLPEVSVSPLLRLAAEAKGAQIFKTVGETDCDFHKEITHNRSVDSYLRHNTRCVFRP